MFAPLDGTLVVTQLHGSMRGGPGEAYMVNHGGVIFHCRGHAGVDFNAALGSPVRAMKAGILSVAPEDPWRGGYSPLGLYAVITLPDGETHTYGHLSEMVLTPGPVAAGTIVARSGTSGNSSGPHLHVCVRPVRPDYANGFDGSIDFLTRFDHDVYARLDLHLV